VGISDGWCQTAIATSLSLEVAVGRLSNSAIYDVWRIRLQGSPEEGCRFWSLHSPMNGPRANRIWWIIYFNPNDQRVIVPMRSKLGLTLNFGNPRSVAALSWICAVWLFALVVAPIVAHPRWFVNEPSDLVFVLSSWVVALGLVRLNQCFAWADYRLLSLASFGVIAAGVGFGIQGLINTPLVMWWGSNLTWQHHLVLGPVAAVSQTFGKWFALSLLLKVRPASSSTQWLRYGLLVGLGFAICEITMLYFRVAWAQETPEFLGIWERASSSMFHIYSTALLVVAMQSKRYWLIPLVIAIHALTDILAGCGGALELSIYGLEGVFSACAAVLWVVFLLTGRTIVGDN
jgi:hypothetical protein